MQLATLLEAQFLRIQFKEGVAILFKNVVNVALRGIFVCYFIFIASLEAGIGKVGCVKKIYLNFLYIV